MGFSDGFAGGFGMVEDVRRRKVAESAQERELQARVLGEQLRDAQLRADLAQRKTVADADRTQRENEAKQRHLEALMQLGQQYADLQARIPLLKAQTSDFNASANSTNQATRHTGIEWDSETGQLAAEAITRLFPPEQLADMAPGSENEHKAMVAYTNLASQDSRFREHLKLAPNERLSVIPVNKADGTSSGQYAMVVVGGKKPRVVHGADKDGDGVPEVIDGSQLPSFAQTVLQPYMDASRAHGGGVYLDAQTRALAESTGATPAQTQEMRARANLEAVYSNDGRVNVDQLSNIPKVGYGADSNTVISTLGVQQDAAAAEAKAQKDAVERAYGAFINETNDWGVWMVRPNADEKSDVLRQRQAGASSIARSAVENYFADNPDKKGNPYVQTVIRDTVRAVGGSIDSTDANASINIESAIQQRLKGIDVAGVGRVLSYTTPQTRNQLAQMYGGEHARDVLLTTLLEANPNLDPGDVVGKALSGNFDREQLIKKAPELEAVFKRVDVQKRTDEWDSKVRALGDAGADAKAQLAWFNSLPPKTRVDMAPVMADYFAKGVAPSPAADATPAPRTLGAPAALKDDEVLRLYLNALKSDPNRRLEVDSYPTSMQTALAKRWYASQPK